jgi:hypothetical protein
LRDYFLASQNKLSREQVYILPEILYEKIWRDGILFVFLPPNHALWHVTETEMPGGTGKGRTGEACSAHRE